MSSLNSSKSQNQISIFRDEKDELEDEFALMSNYSIGHSKIYLHHSFTLEPGKINRIGKVQFLYVSP